jgi:hypothetical protein
MGEIEPHLQEQAQVQSSWEINVDKGANMTTWRSNRMSRKPVW